MNKHKKGGNPRVVPTTTEQAGHICLLFLNIVLLLIYNLYKIGNGSCVVISNPDHHCSYILYYRLETFTSRYSRQQLSHMAENAERKNRRRKVKCGSITVKLKYRIETKLFTATITISPSSWRFWWFFCSRT